MATQNHGRIGKTQAISFNATPANAAAIGPQTFAIRLCATAACLVSIGDASNLYVPPNWPEVLISTPGQILSVVEFSSGNIGQLFLSELE
jgi:hypothetical protein